LRGVHRGHYGRGWDSQRELTRALHARRTRAGPSTAGKPASTSPPLRGRWPRQGSNGGGDAQRRVAEQATRPGVEEAVTAAARPPSPTLPHEATTFTHRSKPRARASKANPRGPMKRASPPPACGGEGLGVGGGPELSEAAVEVLDWTTDEQVLEPSHLRKRPPPRPSPPQAGGGRSAASALTAVIGCRLFLRNRANRERCVNRVAHEGGEGAAGFVRYGAA
jgi:hypothetical protein